MLDKKPPLNRKDWIAGLEKGLQIIEAFNDTHPRLTASTAARPTSDPSVRVIFYTPTPPVAVMLAGDVWEPTV